MATYHLGDGPANRPEPVVKLLAGPRFSVDLAVGAARTCYSSRGVVAPDQVVPSSLPVEERKRAQARRDALARELYQAGHHTTFQHAHYVFALDCVSRQAVWSLLHSHPFYNSEQVSQRYVPMDRVGFYLPRLDPPARTLYQETVSALLRGYRELTGLLEPLAERAYFERFPTRRSQAERWRKEIQKKAQETARSVLPVALFAYLYHTVSALTLLRYRRICESYDVPEEQRAIVERMIEAVRGVDPDFDHLLEDPLPLAESPEFQALTSLGSTPVSPSFAERFDRSLCGRTSLLVSWNPNAEEIVAEAIREVLGTAPEALPDEQALGRCLDPSQNLLLGEALELGVHSKLFRVLHHAHYTFRKKLSHAADSQDQRHRMTPASRPVLAAQIGDGPDVVVPRLIQEEPRVEKRFAELCGMAWEAMNRLKALGVGPEARLYLLPNATAVRFSESTDLLFFHHKATMRLCWNAQEEIWRATVEEVEQIRQVHPKLGRWLGAPCELRFRAKLPPPCPEGKRYCGVPLWRIPPEKRPLRML